MAKKKSYKTDATEIVKDVIENKIDVVSGDVNRLNQEYKKDGWFNVMKGFGTKLDKSIYTDFKPGFLLSDELLLNLYIHDGLSRRIIEIKANDITRQWVTIKNDPDNKIDEKLEELNAEFNFNMAIKWSRLFGGSIILIGADDGGRLEDELNIENIKSVDYLKVYDRTSAIITQFNFNDDPKSKYYREVEFLTIVPRWGQPFNVHVSRLLIFKGEELPEFAENGDLWYWGASSLQHVFEDLKDHSSNKKSLTTIIDEFIISVYKLSNLTELLAEGREDLVKERMELIALMKSVIHGVMIGDTEDYNRSTSSVSGLSDLIDRFMMFISASSGVPVTRLFGRSPAGQNATGEGDEKNYYDDIKALQTRKLKPNVKRLVDIINSMKEYKMKDIFVELNPLSQLTETEELQNKLTQSQIDVAYMDASVIDPKEVRDSRFTGDGYSYDTVLDDSLYEAMQEEKEAFKQSLLNSQTNQNNGEEENEEEENEEENNNEED